MSYYQFIQIYTGLNRAISTAYSTSPQSRYVVCYRNKNKKEVRCGCKTCESHLCFEISLQSQTKYMKQTLVFL